MHSGHQDAQKKSKTTFPSSFFRAWHPRAEGYACLKMRRRLPFEIPRRRFKPSEDLRGGSGSTRRDRHGAAQAQCRNKSTHGFYFVPFSQTHLASAFSLLAIARSMARFVEKLHVKPTVMPRLIWWELLLRRERVNHRAEQVDLLAHRVSDACSDGQKVVARNLIVDRESDRVEAQCR